MHNKESKEQHSKWVSKITYDKNWIRKIFHQEKSFFLNKGESLKQLVEGKWKVIRGKLISLIIQHLQESWDGLNYEKRIVKVENQ